MEDKKHCQYCKDYMNCYNSNQRYNLEVYQEDDTKLCDDYNNNIGGK